jgi:glycine hydroxymethyltransferase
MRKKSLKASDAQLWKYMEGERVRQLDGLEMIPSENYVSLAVREASASILTNKYSEGYPGRRYYGGQEWIDKIEMLAQARALKLFGVTEREYRVNVQPYSGSPANIAVYFALANFGDTLMGMDLTHGGHLTHGHKVNFSGKAYNFVSYGVTRDHHLLDYDAIMQQAETERPRIIVSGATAYPREIDFVKFQEIAQKVGAIHMADISHIAGLIVAGVHPSPFPFVDVVTTTTHKTLRGPRGAMIFSRPEFSEMIDKAVFPGLQGGPHEHIIAAKATCFKEASTVAFRNYGGQIVRNARILGEELSRHGFTLVSGGTDNHLLLVDLTNNNVTGSRAETVLDMVGITVNKNTVPFETGSPFRPSGIRLGTPAITTRGMKEKEMIEIADVIHETLTLAVLKRDIVSRDVKPIRARISKLARKFPLP